MPLGWRAGRSTSKGRLGGDGWPVRLAIGGWFSMLREQKSSKGCRLGHFLFLCTFYLFSGDAGVAGASIGPGAQAVDLVVHRFGEGDSLAEGGQHVRGGQFF